MNSTYIIQGMYNNNSFQHNSNISRVADVIWRNATVSRAEISRQLSLYRSTVSNIIGTLLENGVVLETSVASASASGGRKPITLTLNAALGCVIGIEIQPETYHVVAIDINGEVLLHKHGLTCKADFVEIFDTIYDDCEVEIKKLNLPVLAICVGIPGIIDTTNNLILRSDPFKLENFDFEAEISSKFDIPVLIENDARCCAWADKTRNRSEGLRDFITVMAEHHIGQSNDEIVKAGLGVGIALCSNGKLHHGYQFAAGEYVSHSWRPGIIGQTGLPEEITSRIGSDLHSFRKWVVEFFFTLTPILTVFAPEKLYIHGYPVQYKNIVLQTIQSAVPQFSAILKKNNCTMEFAPVDNTVVARGAACYYVNKLFSISEPNEQGNLKVQTNWDNLFSTLANSK
ncbi:MAG: ROK family transcriptional regulator [Spirochaetaceae bacterium]|nr:ROK family transcriptional regulator [Spirochaetaceae bacterium]